MALKFTCGVLEGFYGRPWTTEQRKDLFKRIEKLGMNSFVYAPKDDLKHRAQWRDLYTVEEAEHLQSLIFAANQNEVCFYYALSPGLDICYSSQKEINAIKRKLDQVKSLGCQWFALLFDDIEPAMCESDRTKFSTFAQAQVAVTNEVFVHLDCASFIFCPTEYCESRAIPNLEDSDYLNTIGQELAPEIQIFWTGPRVISREITVEHLVQVGSVLRRKPIIWDNLFANDYDNKRLFLGPYAGRSAQIKSHVSGLLINPNCEFEANFIAVHTVAQWNDSTGEELEKRVKQVLRSETPDQSVTYQLEKSLELALNDWLPEIASPRHAFAVKPFSADLSDSQLPIAVSQKQLISMGSHSSEAESSSLGNGKQLPSTQFDATTLDQEILEELVSSSRTSFDTQNSSVTTAALTAVNSLTDEYGEPMELAPLAPQTSVHALVEPGRLVGVELMDSSVSNSVDENTNAAIFNCEDQPRKSMQENHDLPAIHKSENLRFPSETADNTNSSDSLDYLHMLSRSDLQLMCGFFYLPFENGPVAHKLFSEFLWLKANACSMRPINSDDCAESENQDCEWMRRAVDFDEICRSVIELCVKLVNCPNRGFVYDMYPYVWELQSNLNSLNCLIKWMGYGHAGTLEVSSFRNGFVDQQEFVEKPSVLDEEPWLNRGGLTAESQRLLSLHTTPDLFISRPPHPPCGRIFRARPVTRSDREFVYGLCRSSLNFDLLPENIGLSTVDDILLTEIVGDRIVGAFLDLCPQYGFICEEIDGSANYSARPIGFGLAALNAKKFSQQYNKSYLPKMRLKYTALMQTTTDMSTKNMLQSLVNIFSGEEKCCEDYGRCVHSLFETFHVFGDNLHTCTVQNYQSFLVFRFNANVLQTAAPKRLLVPLLAALKLHGSRGIFSQVHASDKSSVEICVKFGFSLIVVTSSENHTPSLQNSPLGSDLSYYGRFI